MGRDEREKREKPTTFDHSSFAKVPAGQGFNDEINLGLGDPNGCSRRFAEYLQGKERHHTHTHTKKGIEVVSD
jgi:hypothetical protein